MKNILTATTATAALASTTLISAAAFMSGTPAKAADCIRLVRDNSLACIHNVYSDDYGNKTVVVSLNGNNPRPFNVDCKRPDWEAGSILDKACSEYSR